MDITSVHQRRTTPGRSRPAPRLAPWVMPLLLAAACASQPPAPAASVAWWQAPLGYAGDEVHAIAIGAYDFPTVDVKVMGEPVSLVFDTGNMAGLTLTPQVATRLGLEQEGSATHYHASGEVAGARAIFRVPELQVFGNTWQDEPAHEDPDEAIQGLLGPRYVGGGRFTLDCGRRLMAVSRSPVPATAPGDRLPMARSAEPGLRGLILVKGTLNGVEVLMELDTGKSRCTVDPELAATMGLPEVEGGYFMDRLTLGSHTFSIPSAKDVRMHGIGEGLDLPVTVGVGIDVLAQLVFTADYGQGIVVLDAPAGEAE